MALWSTEPLYRKPTKNQWIKVVIENLADRAMVVMDGQVIGTYDSDSAHD